MGRQRMSSERMRRIKKLTAQKTHIEVASIFGVSRQTVSRIANQCRKEFKKNQSNHIQDLRRKEEKQLLDGCFNVYEKSNWVVG